MVKPIFIKFVISIIVTSCLVLQHIGIFLFSHYCIFLLMDGFGRYALIVVTSNYFRKTSEIFVFKLKRRSLKIVFFGLNLFYC